MMLASVSASTLAADPAYTEARVSHGARLATKKAVDEADLEGLPLLATLEQVHTGEHVVLDPLSPTQARFDDLVADRVTGEKHALDEHLLLLLRALAAEHPGARIELVSGYRSPKLNEILRKKGHHVSSHSQHSLGHACDFRIIPEGQERGIDPRVLQVEIRALGWQGGVGVYPTHDDWFVHADVGRNRHWVN
jgi:uncharacterized protein YcbK (DUF882 family)